jgi:hypothetical protein
MRLKQNGLQNRSAGEEHQDGNRKRLRRRHMLALAITAFAVFLIVIPGFLLIFGLCRAASGEAPTPANSPLVRGPVLRLETLGQQEAARSSEARRRLLARANYN